MLISSIMTGQLFIVYILIILLSPLIKGLTWRFRQVQVPGHPGGLRRRPRRQAIATKLLAPPHHGSMSRRLLRGGFQRREGSDAGRPAVPHNIQCGSGCGRPALVRGTKKWKLWEGCNGRGTFLSGILRRWRDGRRVGPRMTPGRFQRTGSHLRQGRPADKCW